MITYRSGDVTKAPEKIIAHGCNAQGVMGSGVAKAIKEAFPRAYSFYRTQYDLYGLKLGQVVWSSITFNTPYEIIRKGAPNYYKLIANCITQENYGRDGKVYCSYDAIRECMKKINDVCIAQEIPSVAMPKIGAGLAGGDWQIISKIIEEEFSDSIEVVVYTL